MLIIGNRPIYSRHSAYGFVRPSERCEHLDRQYTNAYNDEHPIEDNPLLRASSILSRSLVLLTLLIVGIRDLDDVDTAALARSCIEVCWFLRRTKGMKKMLADCQQNARLAARTKGPRSSAPNRTPSSRTNALNINFRRKRRLRIAGESRLHTAMQPCNDPAATRTSRYGVSTSQHEFRRAYRTRVLPLDHGSSDEIAHIRRRSMESETLSGALLGRGVRWSELLARACGELSPHFNLHLQR